MIYTVGWGYQGAVLPRVHTITNFIRAVGFIAEESVSMVVASTRVRKLDVIAELPDVDL